MKNINNQQKEEKKGGENTTKSALEARYGHQFKFQPETKSPKQKEVRI